jgi:hypothetical protein
MIRFDTFRFDYDTKNVIVFSCADVVLLILRTPCSNVLRVGVVA